MRLGSLQLLRSLSGCGAVQWGQLPHMVPRTCRPLQIPITYGILKIPGP